MVAREVVGAWPAGGRAGSRFWDKYGGKCAYGETQDERPGGGFNGGGLGAGSILRSRRGGGSSFVEQLAKRLD